MMSPRILGILAGVSLSLANAYTMRWLLRKLQQNEGTQSMALPFVFLAKMLSFFGIAWVCMEYLPIDLFTFGVSIVVCMLFSTFLFQKLEAKGDSQHGA